MSKPCVPMSPLTHALHLHRRKRGQQVMHEALPEVQSSRPSLVVRRCEQPWRSFLALLSGSDPSKLIRQR